MKHYHVVVRRDGERRLGALTTTLEAAREEMLIEMASKGREAAFVECTDDCFRTPKRVS